MTHVIVRVHPVYLMNVEQRQVASDPRTKPTDLACEFARGLISSTSTISHCFMHFDVVLLPILCTSSHCFCSAVLMMSGVSTWAGLSSSHNIQVPSMTWLQCQITTAASVEDIVSYLLCYNWLFSCLSVILHRVILSRSSFCALNAHWTAACPAWSIWCYSLCLFTSDGRELSLCRVFFPSADVHFILTLESQHSP